MIQFRNRWFRTRWFRGRRLGRRLLQLYAGLALYGLSIALVIESYLGAMPWDIFHQGIAEKTGLPFGVVLNGVGVLILLLWIPLRQRPGLGTISNALVIGPAADAVLWLLPTPDGLPVRVVYLVLGVVLCGLASALYIGARLGPGPRDGLMTGLAARGWGSLRLVRTGIEIAVVAVGWLLGGTLGVGTLLYALAIGPLVQFFLPLVEVREPTPAPQPAAVGQAGVHAGHT